MLYEHVQLKTRVLLQLSDENVSPSFSIMIKSRSSEAS